MHVLSVNHYGVHFQFTRFDLSDCEIMTPACSEDCREAVTHQLTSQLGSVCPGNESRDWWKKLARGPET